MSKIQKALGKIQGPAAERSQHGAQADIESSQVLARLVDQRTENESYSVSDKVLEVNRAALKEAGLIAPDYHEDLLANQYRDIKRPLIAHAFGKRATQIERGNLIMVTSALAGEGKTFTSINLALSMAHERDHSVLLVDADVAKPHTSEMFGAREEPGLLDALEDPRTPVRSLILPTDVDSLSLLPAGRPRSHATELLASSVMEDVCTTLSRLSTGQIVVFDSPPLLATSEAKVLAGLAGQVVVVVCAEQTSQDAVSGALASLGEDQAVNLVLNQARAGFNGDTYGYGYGYGYGRKYEKEESTKSTGLFD